MWRFLGQNFKKRGSSQNPGYKNKKMLNSLNLKVSLFALFIFNFLFVSTSSAQNLSVSENHRYIVQEDGTPFFWLGDTAWELFHRLDREEATQYLENRAEKGFTVIQAVVLAEFGGLTDPNPYGDLPLINNDPTQPNEAYFEHVDFVVNKAEELGLYIGMLPTWGDKFNQKWGMGPEIFNTINAKEYGEFLAERYKDKPIIWILGGDRNPEKDEHMAIIRSMAEGIEEGYGDVDPFMTYHPQGGSSSIQWFYKDDWLDFHMFQSGHGEVNNPNYERVLEAARRTPRKPVLDGEPNYEDHPIAWNPNNGWFDSFDVRQAAYWSMLAGAMGHTYGNHNIWQMFEPGREPVSSARTPWYEAIDQPGAFQMSYFKQLFEARPFEKLVPFQEMVRGDILNNSSPARAAKASNNSFAVIYIPHGQTIDVSLDMFEDNEVNAWWFNPRMGKTIQLKPVAGGEVHQFDPPADRNRGNDWVLVLDNSEANFETPTFH